MKASQTSSFKRPCCKTQIEPEGRTTDTGILARLPIEGAHLDEHEDGRLSLQLDEDRGIDYSRL